MPSANEIMASFKSRHASKPKRTNWKKELKLERNRVLDEVIEMMRNEIRGELIPEQFKRGHYAAITKLEMMKDESK